MICLLLFVLVDCILLFWDWWDDACLVLYVMACFVVFTVDFGDCYLLLWGVVCLMWSCGGGVL